MLSQADREYRQHANNAQKRGIPFELSFYEWLGIWINSGKFERRGSGKGRYCMGRIGDAGPYAVGNVFICEHGENSRQSIMRWCRGPRSPRAIRLYSTRTRTCFIWDSGIARRIVISAPAFTLREKRRNFICLSLNSCSRSNAGCHYETARQARSESCS